VGGANTTPSYCTPSGREEAFLIEEDEEEEEVYHHHQRKRGGGGGGDGRRKESACEQEAGVADSFGVSSYQVRTRPLFCHFEPFQNCHVTK